MRFEKNENEKEKRKKPDSNDLIIKGNFSIKSLFLDVVP